MGENIFISRHGAELRIFFHLQPQPRNLRKGLPFLHPRTLLPISVATGLLGPQASICPPPHFHCRNGIFLEQRSGKILLPDLRLKFSLGQLFFGGDFT